MNKTRTISEKDLLNELKTERLCLNENLFSKADVEHYKSLDLRLGEANRIGTISTYFLFAINHPKFLFTFIFPQIKKTFLNKITIQEKDWQKSNFILTNNLKASIVKGFRAQSILEIGTYLGAGAASFKYVLPNATIFTINPKDNKGVNNPINEEYIGYFYKKKKMEVNQIYADSKKYDFAKIGEIDFTFIDGNHSYGFVYSDIEKSTKITKKAVLIDDYIPEDKSTSKLVYGPWVQGVVKALDDYLLANPNEYNKAYWIKDTKYALLIK